MRFIFLLTNAVSMIFFAIMLSYYFLLFIKTKNKNSNLRFRSITIIIPAHNEGRFIRDCLRSAKAAKFDGPKKIIVVNDGSTDNTGNEAKYELDKNVKIINTEHNGKANSINLALGQSNTELVAIMDADSIIQENSLIELCNSMPSMEYAASTSVVKVNNRKKFLGMWLHIEQLYNSLIRKILSKINANIVTPGPLSIYRREALIEIGGFSNKGYSEDVDVAVRLIKKGYRIGFSESAISKTNMPITFKGFIKQRIRFAKGWINIFKKHLGISKNIVNIYSLPLAFFFYFQAVVMSFVILYNIFSGYITYFYSKGIFFSFAVARYLIDWISIVGSIKWVFNIFTGIEPLTFFTFVSLSTFLLTYPLYFIAIFKFDRKPDVFHIIPIFFMTPFWLCVMVVYATSIFESLKKNQKNIWEKNE